jgi:(p)ppGpp synthase/HD superfamily hydrolase
MMSKAEILEYVKEFADKAHGTQVRKYSGERYIVHPLRVMEIVRQYNDDLPVLAAALLHDVLEDTSTTSAGIEAALLHVMDKQQVASTLRRVIELTDVFIRKEYPRLKRRTRKEKEAHRLSSVSPEAQTVKYADIMDNVTDIAREDTDFAKVYISEAMKMLKVMDAGHPALRERALAVVDQCAKTVRKPATLI